MSLRYVATVTPSFDDAACKQHPNSLWFDDVSTKQAISICRNDCPILDACLAYALTLPIDTEGVWAGLTKPELNRLRRANGNPPVIDHGSPGGYEKHKRHGIPACQLCKDAHALAQKHRRPSRAKIHNRKETQP